MPKKSTSKTSKGGQNLRLEWVDPRTLQGHPRNWKKHPHRQRQALNASLDENNWAGALLYNERTNKLLDGHMRREEAIRRGDKAVPVLVGSWTPDQELRILATLDPLGAMAETQADALQSLTEQVNAGLANVGKEQKKVLTKLTADIDNYAAEIASGEAPRVMLERKRDKKEYDRARQVEQDDDDSDDDVELDDAVAEMDDDPIFSSSNPWGIPDLLPDCLCREVPDSVWCRSEESQTEKAWYCYSAGPGTIPDAEERGGGFLGFFTEDFRFERTWNDTANFTSWLKRMDFRGVCCPDFSTWTDWPLAIRLHNIYRSRYCGRYWQECGVPVIPIVQSIGACPGLDAKSGVLNSFSHSVCIASLPKKTPVLATEARNSQGQEDYWLGWSYLHKTVISHVQPKVLVIYGGEANQKRFMGRLGRVGKTEIVLLSSFIERRRKGMSRDDKAD